MGSYPSAQPDPEVSSQLALLRAYYQEQTFKKYELNKLKIKSIYNSSNSSCRDLKEINSIKKSAQHAIEEMRPPKEVLYSTLKHQRTLSLPIDSIQLDFISLSLDTMSQLISKDITYQNKKTQNLQEKLKNLQEILESKKTVLKGNLNTMKHVIDKKLKVQHKKTLSEKFTDSTFFTSNTEFKQNSSLNNKQISPSLNEIRGFNELDHKVIDLRQKVLLRDEMKQAVEVYCKEYSRKLRKIADMKEKLGDYQADEIFQAKFSESELKILQNKIFILQKELDNDKNEHSFLMNISMIGKKFDDFQSKCIFKPEKVY